MTETYRIHLDYYNLVVVNNPYQTSVLVDGRVLGEGFKLSFSCTWHQSLQSLEHLGQDNKDIRHAIYHDRLVNFIRSKMEPFKYDGSEQLNDWMVITYHE